MRHRLPWRLGRFLHACYQAGILRIAGSAYQFRHRELQDHLATNSSPPNRTWPTAPLEGGASTSCATCWPERLHPGRRARVGVVATVTGWLGSRLLYSRRRTSATAWGRAYVLVDDEEPGSFAAGACLCAGGRVGGEVREEPQLQAD
jgi:hypothetical protein